MQVVEHDDQLAAERRDGVHELVDRHPRRSRPSRLSRCSAPRPSPGRTRSIAVATYFHSRTGSLSPASSVTQASAASRLAHQARTAVVLPYPAGAATRVRRASLAGVERLPDARSIHHAAPHTGGRRAWPRPAGEAPPHQARPRARADPPPGAARPPPWLRHVPPSPRILAARRPAHHHPVRGGPGHVVESRVGCRGRARSTADGRSPPFAFTGMNPRQSGAMRRIRP